MTKKYHVYASNADRGTRVQITTHPVSHKKCEEIIKRQAVVRGLKFEIIEEK